MCGCTICSDTAPTVLCPNHIQHNMKRFVHIWTMLAWTLYTFPETLLWGQHKNTDCVHAVCMHIDSFISYAKHWYFLIEEEPDGMCRCDPTLPLCTLTTKWHFMSGILWKIDQFGKHKASLKPICLIFPNWPCALRGIVNGSPVAIASISMFSREGGEQGVFLVTHPWFWLTWTQGFLGEELCYHHITANYFWWFSSYGCSCHGHMVSEGSWEGGLPMGMLCIRSQNP